MLNNLYPLTGTLQVPGDKSISHRALMLTSLIPQESQICGLLLSEDVKATYGILTELGVSFNTPLSSDKMTLTGLTAFQEPGNILDAQNSGTTARLMTGLLSPQPFYSVLTGDAALRRRPMGRVVEPLTHMGANIQGRKNNTLAPLSILPPLNPLEGLQYTLPHASAQVKSAILLAGLYAHSETLIEEPIPSRNHTELMLQSLGVELTCFQQGDRNCIRMPARQIERIWEQQQQRIKVPGDISSAAFMLVAASLIPHSEILLSNVGVNPTRMGIVTVLNAMGADITLLNTRLQAGEPVADILVKAVPALKGSISLSEADMPALIDEIPILMIAGLFLHGQLTVTGAGELRHKESDRLEAMRQELAKLGVNIALTEDGFAMEGPYNQILNAPQRLLNAHHDHRIAMSLAVLNRIIAPDVQWEIEGREWVNISFPGFYEILFAR
jgi:3-phosphoshikimate 1-carboxyvinyltransferase